VSSRRHSAGRRAVILSVEERAAMNALTVKLTKYATYHRELVDDLA
jgi:hypothetical protein